MSNKIFFVMNDRTDVSKGYSQVSQENVKKYISEFTDGERAYFINLGYAVMETDEEGYKSFYKEYRRERYVNEEAHAAGVVSLNAIDTDELDGTGVLADTSEPFEDKVLRKLMAEKLPEAISVLTEEEKELIRMIYFNGISERELSAILDIPRKTLSYRKEKILMKLKKYFEN